MFVFSSVLEKRSLQKVEGYVTQISEIKKAKTDILKSYFDMTFQTETTAMCGVCFSPDKHKRLQKFNNESTSCVITNIIRNKKTEFRLSNFSTIKPKTVDFAIKEEHKISSIELIINKCKSESFVNS